MVPFNRREVVSVKPRRTLVARIGIAMIVAGCLLAGLILWQLVGTNLGAQERQVELVGQARETWSAVPEPSVVPTSVEPAESVVVEAPEEVADAPPPVVTPVEPPGHGETVGIVSIDRFGAYEVPVLEGSDPAVLDQGVLGRYEGTGMPCQIGNFAVAGHRTTHGEVLRRVEELQPGDRIVVSWAGGECTYEVDSHTIVAPTAVEVIAPVPSQPDVAPTEGWMTLTTCHPLYSTAERYIVFARLVS